MAVVLGVGFVVVWVLGVLAFGVLGFRGISLWVGVILVVCVVLVYLG